MAEHLRSPEPMRAWTRLRALALVAVMGAALIGCGDSDSDTATAGDDDEVETTTSTAEDETSTTAATPEEEAPETTTGGEVDAAALLLTEEEFGDTVLPPEDGGFFESFEDPEGFVADADDGVLLYGPDGDEPLAEGTEAAQLFVDAGLGRADPAGCWAEDPPEVQEAATRLFGDDIEFAFQLVFVFASPEEAGRAAVPADHLVPDAADRTLTLDDGPDGGGSNSRPCAWGVGAPEAEPCPESDDCTLINDPSTGSTLVIAARGPVVVAIVTAERDDTEDLVLTALDKAAG